MREDVWPPLHTPVNPGAAELAARYQEELAGAAAEPADADSAPGPASAPCTGAAEAGQPPGGAAEALDPGGSGGAAAGSPSALAALQGRLKQAGQSKGGTKARPHSYSAAKARQILSSRLPLKHSVFEYLWGKAMPLSHWSVVKSSVDCGAQVRRALHAQALEQPAPDAPLDAAFRSMLPRLARYRAAWGDANVPCALDSRPSATV